MASLQRCAFHGGALTLVLLVLLISPPSSARLANELWQRGHGGATGRAVGGRTAVEGVEGDREVQELGLFCVVEHNRLSSHSHRLLFSRVVAAQTQVVSGMKYYLRIVARDSHGAGEQVFDAVVVVKAWLAPSRVLVSFVPVADEFSKMLVLQRLKFSEMLAAIHRLLHV